MSIVADGIKVEITFLTVIYIQNEGWKIYIHAPHIRVANKSIAALLHMGMEVVEGASLCRDV